MYDEIQQFLAAKQRLGIIQAENPDGDSLGSSLALTEMLEATGKTVTQYCPVNIPRYLHYFDGWDQVTSDFDFAADAYILVDTASATLISKLLDNPAIKNRLTSAPVLVLDHHEADDDLPFEHLLFCETRPACCELIFILAETLGLPISSNTANVLMGGIASDTLGFTSQSMTAATFSAMARLTELGGNIAGVEDARREFMKKSRRILAYKGELISHIEYYLDGKLAVVHIPWEEIREYSDEYNPGVLIIEEMKMVTGVEVAVAVKTYPDGKVTGKIRTSAPIADTLAGFWGGGGHLYASGFRTHDDTYETVLRDLIHETARLLPEDQPTPTHDSGNRMRIGKL